MKAIRVTRYGTPDVLGVADVDTPRPGAGEVAIEVTHAAVGLIDVLIRRGDFVAHDLPMQPPYTPGIEAAGTVVEVGAGVTSLRVGERVVTLSIATGGGYAERMIAPAAATFALPDGVDSAQAVAALPNATTAQLTLTRAVPMAAGARVLVLGATGALASVFPGVARRLGAAEVAGLVRSREREAEAVRLGFDVVTTSDDMGALAGEGFDVVVDPVGGVLRGRALDLLAPMGRLVAVGSADTPEGLPVDTNTLWFRNLGVVGFAVGQYLLRHPDGAVDAVAAVLPALAEGDIRLRTRELPLGSAAEAHALMERGGVEGRMLLRP